MQTESFDAIWAAREAAHWAAWSAAAAWLIGLASLAVTGGGLWFVSRQLRATEEAATAAWMTSRPWLTFDIENETTTTQKIRKGSAKTHLTLTIKVDNAGASPALDVKVYGGAVPAGEWASGTGEVSTARLDPLELGALMPGGDIAYVFHVDWFEEWERDCLLGIRCEYSVPGLRSRRFTALAFDAFRTNDNSLSVSQSPHGEVVYERRVAHVSRLHEHRSFMT